MGNIVALHKDIRKHLFTKYLDESCVTMLWWSVGVKKPLYERFFKISLENLYIDLFKWGFDYKEPSVEIETFYGGVYAFIMKIVEKGDVETLIWSKKVFDHSWKHYNYWNYSSERWRVYEINNFIECSLERDNLDMFKYFESLYIKEKNVYENLLDYEISGPITKKYILQCLLRYL
jgi:hypothetical protein